MGMVAIAARGIPSHVLWFGKANIAAGDGSAIVSIFEGHLRGLSVPFSIARGNHTCHFGRTSNNQPKW